MAEIVDLRQYRRTASAPVVAEIGEEIVPVVTISAAGMRVARPASWQPRRHIQFRIVPQSGDDLDYAHAIPISGHVVGQGRDHLRIAFAAVSVRLADVIEAHATDRPDGARPDSYYGAPEPPHRGS